MKAHMMRDIVMSGLQRTVRTSAMSLAFGVSALMCSEIGRFFVV